MSYTPEWNWFTWAESLFGIYPPPVSAHETGDLTGKGQLAGTTKQKISAEFTGTGRLSMDLTGMKQSGTMHLAGHGGLTDADHTHTGNLSGHGRLTGAAVATTWQLTWGAPTSQATPIQEVFGLLPGKEQNLETKIMWIGCDGSLWHLNGNFAGAQGLTLAPHIAGMMHSPFKSIFSAGPYQIGGYYERTDYPYREINIGVMVGIDYGGPNADALNTSNFRYRMLEQSWWRSWSPSQPGYFCVYTRTHGWRFLRALLAEAPGTPFELDPTAFDNNFMQWDMKVAVLQPFYNKKMLTKTWKNNSNTSIVYADLITVLAELENQFLGGALQGDGGTLVPGRDIGAYTFSMWNNGDFPAWPKFFVYLPNGGIVWIQDGPGGNMLQIPSGTNTLLPSTGPILVDTDPTARTITSIQDSNDPALYDIQSAQGLFDLLLNPTVNEDLPLWSQFGNFFTTPMPKNAQSPIQVYATDPQAVINIYVPQQYDRAYG